jgi:hypothetical protein
MRCLNRCPQKAIEAAHGMATGIMILVTSANAWLMMFIINSLGIAPEAWWWKLLSQFIGIGVMIVVAATVYLIMHYAMEFKPVRFLVRFTSLTTIPGWRRYKYLKENKPPDHIKASNN